MGIASDLNANYSVPSIWFTKDIVSCVSSGFTALTGYTPDDLLGMTCEKLLKLLKLISDIPLNEHTFKTNSFIYTKTLNPIELVIAAKKDNENSTYRYIFIEKSNSCFIEKFPFIHQVFSSSSIVIIIFKVPEMTIIDANDAFFAIMDEPYNKKETLIAKSLPKLIPSWADSTFNNIWSYLLNTGKSLHIPDHQKNFKYGETHWDITMTPIYEDGVLKYYIGMGSNITEIVLNKKRIEAQNYIIDDQKNNLTSIIKNANDALLLVDKEYNINPLNEEAEKLFNISQKNIKNIYDMKSFISLYTMDGEFIPLENSPAYHALKGETISCFRMHIKSPNKEFYINISCKPIFDNLGNIISAIISIRDIEKIINKEFELKSRHDSMIKILDELDLPLLTLSYPDLTIKHINKKAYKLVEFLKNNTIVEVCKKLEPGCIITDCIPYLSFDKCKYLKQLEETKQIVKISNIELLKDKKKYYVNAIFQPLLNSEGEIETILLMEYDVTKEVEEKNKLNEALKIQSEFFSYLSHEFKTPITVINASIQAMEFLHKQELSENIKKYINKIKRSSLQQIRLVNNLLEITKADTGYLTIENRYIDIVTLTKAITDSVGQIARQKGVNLFFSTSVNNKYMLVDDAKLERILLNLLSNAIKFTPTGKSINVNLDTINENIIIDVIDEGPGIPLDKYDIIFEKYGQVRNSLTRVNEGTGLGLCLVKKLVDSLNGNLLLSSTEGQGSSFKIVLPIIAGITNETFETVSDLLEDRLIQTMKVEFSDIYFV